VLSKWAAILGTGELVAVVGGLVISAIFFPGSTSETNGTQKLIGVDATFNTEIATFTQLAYAHAELGNPGPIQNPFAQRYSLLLKMMEFTPDQHPQPVYKSDENGTFIIITPGGNIDEDFDYSKVMLSTVLSQPCKSNVTNLQGNQRLSFDKCTDPDDPNYRGATDMYGTQGPPVLNDTSMPQYADEQMDVFNSDKYCIFGDLLGGVTKEEDVWTSGGGDVHTIQKEPKLMPDEHQAYLQIRALIRTTYRQEFARQMNIPLTDSRGLIHVVFPDEYKIILQTIKDNGKAKFDAASAKDLDTMLWGTEARMEQEGDGGLSGNAQSKVDVGQSIGSRLLALTKDNGHSGAIVNDLNIDENNQDWHPVNQSCLPDPSDTKTVAKNQQMFGDIKLYGGLVSATPYLGIDDKGWDAQKAETRLAEFYNNVGAEKPTVLANAQTGGTTATTVVTGGH
jgi:hypothetical protein